MLIRREINKQTRSCAALPGGSRASGNNRRRIAACIRPINTTSRTENDDDDQDDNKKNKKKKNTAVMMMTTTIARARAGAAGAGTLNSARVEFPAFPETDSAAAANGSINELRTQ